MKLCSELGCTRPLLARGLCGTHYMRIWRKGRPLNEAYSERAVERVRQWREKHPERYREQGRTQRARDPLANYKQRAHAAVCRAIKRGEMTRPETCSRCDATSRIEAHHEDYEKPLDVIWLCTKCHQRYHTGYVKVERP